MSAPSNAAAAAAPANPAAGTMRKRLVIIVLLTFLLAGGAYVLYWLAILRFRVSTQDAYVAGNQVQITSQVSGTAVAINADDTQQVQAGQVLVRLDRASPHAALMLAEAALAEAVRAVRSQFAQVAEVRASLSARHVDLRRAQADLSRRERLAASGAISTEDVQHAREAVQIARAASEAAEQRLAQDRALVEGATVASNPRVESAAARLRTTYLDYGRTVVPAPVGGIVAKRTVQLGQRVNPGAVLMTVVPLNEVWVDANFKEGQLSAIRAGQPVRLWADANDFEYHGTVRGFSAGTGAAFAVLPAQNATGNWIKVVQRLPVRVALDPNELHAHPLQIGLSMQVSIDTRHPRSAPENQSALQSAASGGLSTAVFDGEERGADELIAKIIAENDLPLARAEPRPERAHSLVRN